MSVSAPRATTFKAPAQEKTLMEWLGLKPFQSPSTLEEALPKNRSRILALLGIGASAVGLTSWLG